MTLKLKRTPGLYLVGFMGTGKTTVGRTLAEELGWAFFDLDSEVEKREQRAITQIFEGSGEEHFRALETSALERLVSRVQSGHPCVIATGGGAFVRQHNWNIVENNGVTIWLDCPVETIELRLGTEDKTRPLSWDRAKMRELYELRRPLYARADFQIDADCSDPLQVMERIRDLPIF
jgi:shikimate kinase